MLCCWGDNLKCNQTTPCLRHNITVLTLNEIVTFNDYLLCEGALKAPQGHPVASRPNREYISLKNALTRDA